MRPAFLILLTIVCLKCLAQDTQGNSQELFSKGLKLYEIEKAIITYEVDGQPNDTLVVGFDRYGWRQVTMEYGEKLYYGLKTKINTKEIVDGHTTFDMNLKDKKGKVLYDRSLTDLAGYKNPTELLEARMAKLKAVKTGTETILDKPCETWEYDSKGKKMKIWTWNGIFLKHISPKGTSTALEINLAPDISEMLFVPPQDVVLTHHD